MVPLSGFESLLRELMDIDALIKRQKRANS
jgi:hypothetical protein